MSTGPEMETSADPLILSCGGASAAGETAASLAGELAAAALGTTGREPEPGRPLIAVDGCDAACCSRRIEAAGLHAAVTLDASSFRRPAAAVAATRRQLDRRRPRRHRSRPQPPPQAATPGRAHSVRDYLLALDALTAPVVDCGAIAAGLSAVAAHVSQLLSVSRPTANEMLERLEVDRLIRRTSTRQIVLTPQGRAAADEALRRQRLLECFAVDFLGYDLADAFDNAQTLGDAFDDEAIRRLDVVLGHPERCPHGRPLDPARARAEAAALRALGALENGEEATVAWVEERSQPLLREQLAAGIRPGATVAAATRAGLSPAAGAAALVRLE
jgi:Mn-dependent DtxR family transcriptional regulator